MEPGRNQFKIMEKRQFYHAERTHPNYRVAVRYFMSHKQRKTVINKKSRIHAHNL